LPRSEASATGPYSDSVESRPHRHILFWNILIFSLHLRLGLIPNACYIPTHLPLLYLITIKYVVKCTNSEDPRLVCIYMCIYI
jgi:hypothetical protein